MLAHSDIGAYLIGAWYRPPAPGEVESIRALGAEWNELKHHVTGTIVVGDMIVHHKRWLRWSTRNSPEGEALPSSCVKAGWEQMVKGPTRGEYLLDLVMTDIEQMRHRILSKLADHALIWAQLVISIPTSVASKRQVWQYVKGESRSGRAQAAASRRRLGLYGKF